MGSHSNQLASYLIAWIIITFIGVILFLLPVVYDVQAAFTGFALFGIGVLFAGTGFGMTINYSVRILKQKFSEPKALPIVEWILSDEEWKQYCIQRLKYNLKSYLNLYYLVIASGLIIDVVLLFVLEEQTTIIDILLYDFILIILSVIIFTFFNYLSYILGSGEVKIYNSSVMLSGVLYNWGIPQGKLINVELVVSKCEKKFCKSACSFIRNEQGYLYCQ